MKLESSVTISHTIIKLMEQFLKFTYVVHCAIWYQTLKKRHSNGWTKQFYLKAFLSILLYRIQTLI